MGEQQPVAEISPVARWGLWLGPALAAGLWVAAGLGYTLAPERPELNAMAGVAIWMALWWMTEAVPAPVTGLLPLVLLPLAGIAPTSTVALRYGDSMIYLFLGGFLVALAIEQSGLQRRVALAVIAWIGTSPRRLVLGFMLGTWALSMWMSNTAITLTMLPIALSVVQRGDLELGGGADRRFGIAALLGVAYAANVGGVGTLIGTPTNVAFHQIYTQQFPAAPPISFGLWMLMAVPISFALLLGIWFILCWFLFPSTSGGGTSSHESIAAARAELGRWSPAERRTGLIFLTAAVLWVTRQPTPTTGWVPWLGLVNTDGVVLVNDATVAIGMALVCFIVPERGWGSPALLSWEAALRVPWGVLLMFGGGLALAAGLTTSGLDQWLGEALGAQLHGMPPLLTVGANVTGMTFLTELTSNVACVTMSMPILGAIASSLGCDPRLLMIPAALAASCAFMLPVATPPNAIVYASGRIRLREMVLTGIWLNLFSIVVITLGIFILGPLVLGIQLEGLPAWAEAGAEAGTTSGGGQ